MKPIIYIMPGVLILQIQNLKPIYVVQISQDHITGQWKSWDETTTPQYPSILHPFQKVTLAVQNFSQLKYFPFQSIPRDFRVTVAQQFQTQHRVFWEEEFGSCVLFFHALSFYFFILDLMGKGILKPDKYRHEACASLHPLHRASQDRKA